jgi:hypothetical protein
VILDLLPVVYGDDERHMVLTKADGKTRSIVLNKKQDDGTIENELSAGDYDIEIDAGPSFAIQKEIALEFLQDTLQANPQAFNLVADIWAKNLDVQFMPQLAERFKTLVPPEILAKEAGEPPPPPPPPPPEAMMAQQQMQMQAQEMKLKQQKIQMEGQDQAAQLAERARELQIREDKHQLEKLELLLKARELQDNMSTNKTDHAIDLHKTELNYNAQIAKILADLHSQERSLNHPDKSK